MQTEMELTTDGISSDDRKTLSWLWAINNYKQNEYYKKKYSYGVLELTPHIAGSIICQSFRDHPKLLSEAYMNLSLNWLIILWEAFPTETRGNWRGSTDLNFQEINWLLFKSLAHNVTKMKYVEIFGPNWVKVWDELDVEFKIRTKKEIEEKRICVDLEHAKRKQL